MRKISAFLFAMVCTLSMSAAVQSKLGIYMYSDANDWLEEGVLIGAGDSYAPFNTANCASYFGVGSNTNNYGVYAVYQGGNYSELYAPELVNIPLVVITSAESASKQGYSFYIEWNGVANNSQPVYLTDLRASGGAQTVELTDTYEYAFDLSGEAAYVEGTKSVIADRFILNYNPSAFVTSVTTNAYGWASYSYNANVQPALPAGLKIYTGEFDGASTLNLTEMDYVKADEGVVVYGAPNTTYYFAAGTGSSVYGTNHLKPSSAYTVGDPNVYVLKGEELREYVGTTTLAENKAYLQLPAAAPAPAIRMVINQTQAIENVETAAPVEKFMENGQVLIKRGDAIYNLQGQMVK